MMTSVGARFPARPGRAVALLGLAAATLVILQTVGLGARQAVERRVYVSVVDDKGAPVPDLTPADFIVREDGAAREVLRAGRATDPMQIAVLVDDTQAATPAILDERKGLQAFVAALNEGHEIALVTFGERPTILVEYTPTLAKLTAGIDRIFSRPGSGSYLLEAILETTKGLQKREAKRPVIVALTTEGEEFSNDYYVTVLEALRKSRAQFHAIIRSQGDPAGATSDAVRNRSFVLAEGTAQTGGRRDYILTDSAFATKLPELAAELKNQYLLVYTRPQTLIPPEKLEVSVRRPGLIARASTVASTP
jgi:Ca-activated chloride channel family protein